MYALKKIKLYSILPYVISLVIHEGIIVHWKQGADE